MTHARTLSTVVAIMGSTSAAGANGVPELTASTPLSDTGHYNISWAIVNNGAVVELQESRTADFAEPTVIYEGLDRATVLSGRLDGEYHYRARVAGGEWSKPTIVAVQHHSLAEAFVFLAMGAAVFLATALLIIGGHIKHKRETTGRDVA